VTTLPSYDAAAGQDIRPRRISRKASGVDAVFEHSARAVGASVLVITGGVGLFLGWQAYPTLSRYGLGFFTESSWNPESDVVGIAAVLTGTISIAIVAMFFAFPLSLLTALFISEYAPERAKATLVAMVDLMAAVPSIVYGLWGYLLVMPHAGDLAVAMMVLPMACAVMRQVFSQTPQGEKEAALALGATKWGMITSVVLPFGRGGIIGGTMLGLGRALGETIAVVLIISPTFEVKPNLTEIGSNSVSALIAGRFGEANAAQLSALLAAGFVLFLITLVVNTLASVVVNRSRSGAGTDA
jgi:phosphate transport system permease protein